MEGNELGTLAYITVGKHSEIETDVWRKVCMKHGVNNFSAMNYYLPWKEPQKFRLKLIKYTRKQAIGEYEGIRADPLNFQKENDDIIKQMQSNNNGSVLLKNGIIVNQIWDRSNEEIRDIRSKNEAKYGIPDYVADTITIPKILPIQYIRQNMIRRRQALLLYRAGILSEIARREHVMWPDLKVDELQIRSGKDLNSRRSYKAIHPKVDTSSIFF